MKSLGAGPGDLSDRQRGRAGPAHLAGQAPPTSPGRPRPLSLLVVGDAAVDHCLLAGVDDDERQVDDRVGRGRPAGLLLHLAVPLHQVLEGNLLKKTHNWHTLIPTATQQLVSPWAYETALPGPSQHQEDWPPERSEWLPREPPARENTPRTKSPGDRPRARGGCLQHPAASQQEPIPAG